MKGRKNFLLKKALGLFFGKKFIKRFELTYY